MKKLFFYLLIAVCPLEIFGQSSTITVHYKPNVTIGQDANVWELHQVNGRPCTTTTNITPQTTNYGNDEVVSFSAWTWNSGGCPRGTTRFLLRFPQLDIIPGGQNENSNGPNNAVIESAVLHLYGVPQNAPAYGNNYYPGTPASTNNINRGWVKRVLPGFDGSANNWRENSVTWITQPQTDPNTANWVQIPETGARYNWDIDVDITDIVRNIHQEVNGYQTQTAPFTFIPPNIFANNGILIQLQQEVHYRGQVYASSDNPDPELWPELEVTYTLPYPCNGSFNYTNDPANPLHFTYSAVFQKLYLFE